MSLRSPFKNSVDFYYSHHEAKEVFGICILFKLQPRIHVTFNFVKLTKKLLELLYFSNLYVYLVSNYLMIWWTILCCVVQLEIKSKRMIIYPGKSEINRWGKGQIRNVGRWVERIDNFISMILIPNPQTEAVCTLNLKSAMRSSVYYSSFCLFFGLLPAVKISFRIFIVCAN